MILDVISLFWLGVAPIFSSVQESSMGASSANSHITRMAEIVMAKWVEQTSLAQSTSIWVYGLNLGVSPFTGRPKLARPKSTLSREPSRVSQLLVYL